MIDKLYNYRFELFFFSLVFILFGAIFFPIEWFEDVLVPILFLGNLLSGILLISRSKNLLKFFSFLFLIVLFLYLIKVVLKFKSNHVETVGFGVYFLFYASVTVELIKQIWKASIIKKNVIIGLMCGYISLGLVFFFIFLTINAFVPGSFNGIDPNNKAVMFDDLLYFSYITLLTIGYGEITPIGLLAKKTAVLTGLAGQFYLVILTAIIVGKYINQDSFSKIDDSK